MWTTAGHNNKYSVGDTPLLCVLLVNPVTTTKHSECCLHTVLVFHTIVGTNNNCFPNENQAIWLRNVDQYVFREVGTDVLSVIYINLRPQRRHATVKKDTRLYCLGRRVSKPEVVTVKASGIYGSCDKQWNIIWEEQNSISCRTVAAKRR